MIVWILYFKTRIFIVCACTLKALLQFTSKVLDSNIKIVRIVDLTSQVFVPQEGGRVATSKVRTSKHWNYFDYLTKAQVIKIQSQIVKITRLLISAYYLHMGKLKIFSFFPLLKLTIFVGPRIYLTLLAFYRPILTSQPLFRFLMLWP